MSVIYKDGQYYGQGGGGGSTYTAGDGIDITNDVISTEKSQSGDMDEIVDVLPTGGINTVCGFTPVGTIISIFSETAPLHYLKCDGATYNKADYPELANHLLSLTTHSQYEVSGDATKFKVPDLRGEFLRGTGTNGHANNGSGANVGVHQDATAMPYEFVDVPGTNKIALSGNSSEALRISNIDSQQMRGTGDSKWLYSTVGSVGPGPSTVWDSITTRPTNTSVLYCIATKDIYSNPINDYSTNEKVVGTWIDGKPLYQKTYEVASISVGNTESGTVLDSNFTSSGKRLISANGSCEWGTNNGTAFRLVPFIYPSSGIYFDIVVASGELKISCMRTSGTTTVYNTKITIQYTKTTD